MYSISGIYTLRDVNEAHSEGYAQGVRAGIAQRDREHAEGVEIEWREVKLGYWSGIVNEKEVVAVGNLGLQLFGNDSNRWAVMFPYIEEALGFVLSDEDLPIEFPDLDSAKAEAARQLNELRNILNGRKP